MLLKLSLFASLLVCAVAQSTTTATLTTTANLSGATTTGGVISPQYALSGFEGCEAKKGLDPGKIKDGFSEMITMIQGSTFGYYPSVNWNGGAAQDYWGPYARNSDWRSLITANLNRAASVSYQYWLNPLAPRLHVRCDDPANACPCPPGRGRTIAYTINNAPHINFCPPYFSLPSLDTALAGQDQQKQGFITYWDNRARVWAHELMHIREIGQPSDTTLYSGIKDQPVQGWPGIPYNPGLPRSNTPAYGDWFTKWLAQSRGNLPDDPVNNADNYALFMLANYVQSKKGWYPSRRQVPISPTTLRGYSISANGTSVDVNTVYGDSPFNLGGYCYSHSDDVNVAAAASSNGDTATRTATNVGGTTGGLRATGATSSR